jgi:hypothetical protein
MANYLIAISGHSGTNWQIKGTALACYTLATLSKIIPSHSHTSELTKTSTGVQHKVRLLVLERCRNHQDLYIALCHHHWFRRARWRHLCRKSYVKLQGRLFGQLDSFRIRNDHSIVSCDLLIWRLQQCLQRGKRSQGMLSVHPRAI